MRCIPLAVLVVLAACGDSTGSRPAMPASFQVIQGAGQIATVATELPQAVEVRVVDASAGPVPNYPINWQALDGGSAHSTVVYSGTDGIARQRWTLGTRTGTQRLVARALDGETGAVLVDDTITAMSTPDVAWGYWKYPAVAITVATGDSVWVWVEHHDSHNNADAPCEDGGARDRIAWQSSEPRVASDTTTTNARGEIGTWLHGVSAGSASVMAVDSRDKTFGFYGTCIAAAAGTEAKEISWGVTVTP